MSCKVKFWCQLTNAFGFQCLKLTYCVPKWANNAHILFCYFLIFYMSRFLASFIHFRLCYQQLTVINCSIKVSDDWIRTRVFWYRSDHTVNCVHNYFPIKTVCLGLTCWSRKISLRSRLALNMKTLECILISVIELGGKDWATATNPTFWYPGSKLPARSPPMLWCLIFK